MRRQASQVLDDFLVASARGGDASPFAKLFERWNPRLTAHAWRLLGHADDAREATQSGWLEIAQGLRRLRDERAFPAWAYRIVSRRCARTIARAIRERGAREGEPHCAEPDPGDRIAASEVRAAVRGLPRDQRAAVALFYFEEMSVGEVAVALDVPVGTAKTRLMHARRKLRAVLEGDQR